MLKLRLQKGVSKLRPYEKEVGLVDFTLTRSFPDLLFAMFVKMK